MKKQTSTSKVSFYLITAIVFAGVLSTAAFAGWKPHSAGPLKPGDFQGPVPNPLPKEDGVEIKSKVSTGIKTVNVAYTG